MKTHQQLILGIIALAIGIFLMGSGIFEPEELFMTFNIPRSAGVYLAFGGMGIAGYGISQIVTLLQNRQRTQADLVSWAQQERTQATLVGAICMALGAIVVGSLLWSLIGVMQTGSSIRIRPVPIGFGIGIGGLLVWLGAMLIKVAIGRS
jgi:hypothetical protein